MTVLLSPVGGAAAQFFDNNGTPLTGGKLYSYVAGTTTPQATYTSASGATAHTNPIILDSGGRVPGGEIWLTDGLQYKFVLKTSTDVLIGTYDNLVGVNSNFVNFLTDTEVQTATAGQTVFTLTTMQYQQNTNNLTVYVDGVNQIDGSTYSYVETSPTVVTFTAGLHVGALVKFTTAQTLSTGVTDASLVTYDPPFTASVTTTVEDKLAQTVSVKDFGAVGDGVTDDTAAINDACAALTQGQVLYFPAGQYIIGQIIINGKSNVGISAYGARFTLSGNSAGFVVKGVCTNIFVQGGVITGDGVNRDASPSTAQIGWLFGNEAGAFVQNVFVQDVIVDSANIGFKFAAGTGTGSGNTNNVKISRCQTKDIVGLVGGIGYGFQFSQAPNSIISDCQAINCGRHGIYFAEGRDYVATNCIVRDHRSTVYNASYRVAFSISRSRNVAVSNCVFDNCYDGTIEIDVDTQGTAPDNVSIGTAITNCTFLNSELADIRIGTVPATDGTVYDVTISNCVVVRKSANGNTSIVIEGGERVKITDNLINGTLAAANFRAITLNGTSGATYTNDVEIVRNTINSAAYGVQVASALQTGTTRVRVLDNSITATTAELEFVGGENATTNNNLIYNRTGGFNALRSYLSSGSNVVIPVGGLNVLTISASSATTVSNFSGGVEGQELTCYFGNANTTLLATNLYLAGAVNFVSSAQDTLTIVYISGFWREKCRSIN